MNSLRLMLRLFIGMACLSSTFGCGGSSSSQSSPSPEQIQGVAMPDNIAVVTATNAD